MADDDLVALATREMAMLGLVSAEQVIGGAVVRQEKAYPVYDEDYAANVAAMRARAGRALPHAASGRAQRHAPLQQPGSRDDDRDADGGEYPCRNSGSTTPGASTKMPNITRLVTKAREASAAAAPA